MKLIRTTFVTAACNQLTVRRFGVQRDGHGHGHGHGPRSTVHGSRLTVHGLRITAFGPGKTSEVPVPAEVRFAGLPVLSAIIRLAVYVFRGPCSVTVTVTVTDQRA